MGFRIFISIVLITCAYFAYETVRFKVLQHSLLNAPAEQSLGNPDGDLVFVKFFEYNCAQCRAGFPVIEQALRQDGNVTFIPRPIRLLESEGIDPALLVYAAAKHGKFAQMHDALVKNYRVINGQVLKDLAEDVGINAEVLEADVKSKAVAKMARKNQKLFARYRLPGTPAYAIGKHILFVSDRDLSANEFIDLFNEARGY